jgi:hypothetical protein
MTAYIRCALALTLGLAVAAATPSPPPATNMAEPLRAGQFSWAPQLAPEGPVTIIVSLTAQRAYTYRNGVPIAVSTVSTGKPGHATPTGVFTILQKDLDHKSNLYHDAPMPFMQRLTWQGIALHGGHLPGFPASHGCIRLPPKFAELLFGITKLGLTVVITDDSDAPQAVSLPIVLAGPKGVERSPARYCWEPEKSPSGPVSIVISGRDRRIVVLRNGIQIGTSTVSIDGPVETTMAFTLGSVDGQDYNWLRLPIPGTAIESGTAMSAAERARVHLPEGFRAALDSVLQAGTTLLVTRDTLQASGLGTRLTVISTEEE